MMFICYDKFGDISLFVYTVGKYRLAPCFDTVTNSLCIYGGYSIGLPLVLIPLLIVYVAHNYSNEGKIATCEQH